MTLKAECGECKTVLSLKAGEGGNQGSAEER